jgi:hypothetical protein
MTLDRQFSRTPANGCRGCGYDFSSLEAFDRHRSLWPEHRRDELCPFDDDDLRAAGFAQNGLGRWGIAARMARTLSWAQSRTAKREKASPRKAGT